jgi:hypothetical protein
MVLRDFDVMHHVQERLDSFAAKNMLDKGTLKLTPALISLRRYNRPLRSPKFFAQLAHV